MSSRCTTCDRLSCICNAPIYVLPLEPLGRFERGVQCDHTYGYWGVTDRGDQFYGFGVTTVFQRDLWIRAGATVDERVARCLAIHWLCKECETIQLPGSRHAAPKAEGVLMFPNSDNVVDRSQETDMHHRCSGHLPKGGLGPAIEECIENAEGEFWVANGEYASQVNFCPYCGTKASKSQVAR